MNKLTVPYLYSGIESEIKKILTIGIYFNMDKSQNKWAESIKPGLGEST